MKKFTPAILTQTPKYPELRNYRRTWRGSLGTTFIATEFGKCDHFSIPIISRKNLAECARLNPRLIVVHKPKPKTVFTYATITRSWYFLFSLSAALIILSFLKP